MNFIEAKQKAIELTKKKDIAHSVVMTDLTNRQFSARTFESAIKTGSFIHYNAHAYLKSKKYTIIIPAYNEELRLPDTIADIYRTQRREEFSIIVVQDGSTDWTQKDWRVRYPEITMLWNKEQRGVGYSFDRGVSIAQTELLILQGADIRFDRAGFIDSFLERVKENKQSLICTRVAQCNLDKPSFYLNEQRQPMYRDHKLGVYQGASILFDHASSKLEFRRKLEAKWHPPRDADGNKHTEGVHEIGCILGAFYGVNKSWYEHIGGFRAHRQWGTLEPLISLRSYLLGGNCLIDLDTTTGHMFMSEGSFKLLHNLVYNKLITADLMPRKLRDDVFSWCESLRELGSLALSLYNESEEVESARDYYAELLPKHSATQYKLIRRACLDV